MPEPAELARKPVVEAPAQKAPVSAARAGSDGVAELLNGRPQVRNLQHAAERLSNRPPGARPVQPGVTQMMKIRGQPTNSEVSHTTRGKHVDASAASRGVAAVENRNSTTFVESDDKLTGPVNAHDHDFNVLKGQKGARFDFTANVAIHLYMKPIVGEGNPVHHVVDGEQRICEIGAEKPGAPGQQPEVIRVSHFKIAQLPVLPVAAPQPAVAAAQPAQLPAVAVPQQPAAVAAPPQQQPVVAVAGAPQAPPPAIAGQQGGQQEGH